MCALSAVAAAASAAFGRLDGRALRLENDAVLRPVRASAELFLANFTAWTVAG